MTAQDVVNAILGVSSNEEVREAMLIGSYLESGWNQSAVGDNGTSFGPFQMHVGGALTAAGGTPADAENPAWAAQNMEAAYASAVNQVPASTWTSNPELAAEESAVIAESPAETYYQSQGTTAVNNAWAATQGALSGVTATAGAVPSGTSTTTSLLSTGPFPGGSWDPLNWGFSLGNAAENAIIGTVENAAKGIGEDIWAKARGWLIRLGLMLIGVLVVLAGINGLFKSASAGPTQIAVSGVRSAARRVARLWIT